MPALQENLVLRSDISSGVVTNVIFLVVLPLLLKAVIMALKILM